MAVAAHALTTLVTVLDELTLVSDGGAQDARLERYINAASSFIARHCGRTFERTAGIVENAKGYGSCFLLVRRTPIVSITSIAIDGAVLGASEYAIEDAEAGRIFRATGFPWTAPAAGGISEAQLPGQEDPTRIVVTYDGGYQTPAQGGTRTLPWDLEDACVELVTSRWRARGNDKRIRQETHEAKSYSFGGVPVPPEILAVLTSYARISNA